MPDFSEICNEKLETRGDRGVRKVDELVREKVGEAVHYNNIVAVEHIDDIVANVLGIEDDDITELAKARVRLVIAHMKERMPPRVRRRAERVVDGDIPSYYEARRRFNELNQ